MNWAWRNCRSRYNITRRDVLYTSFHKAYSIRHYHPIMKRLLLFYILFSLTGLAFAQSGFQIGCHIRGLSAEWVYLGFYQGDQTLLKDSAKVENGSFVFKGKETLAGGLYMIVLPPSNNHFDLMIDADQVAKVLDFELKTSN